MSERLKILFASAEVAPLAKVGGLADVAGALPKALAALGHDVRIVMPHYRMIDLNPAWRLEDVLPAFPVQLGDGRTFEATLSRTWLGDPDRAVEGTAEVPVYLVGGHPHFAAATDSAKVYSLDPEPYLFFDRAIAAIAPRLEPAWAPDVLHCNDWHTGLVPVYVRALPEYRDQAAWRNSAHVFTIHNLAHPGEFDRAILRRAGLPDSLFTYDQLEFYGRVSLLKGGLVFSDRVNTVSPTYAREIQTPEYGHRMDGLLRYLAREGRLSGILNGIDTVEYDPATDRHLPAHFSADKPAGKSRCRAALRTELGLKQSRDSAVVGIISRLSDQKGFDLIMQAAMELCRMPIQLALLGTGEPRYEEYFKSVASAHPGRVAVRIGFDEPLARRIYAGCDMFLMPSRFEPCGLGQLLSLRYGTIPMVRVTGGLADTIRDADTDPLSGNGFSFDEYNATAMLDAIQRGLAGWSDKVRWRTLVDGALLSDFSWVRSAREYVELYKGALMQVEAAAA